MKRLRIDVRGAVQGVGFRPFVHRLAGELGLSGWVRNGGQGVTIEIEGAGVEAFLERLRAEPPPRALIQGLEASHLDPVGYRGFEIRESDESDAKTAVVMPDIATCGECLRELFDRHDRRHLYPFTNCTNCGPRYSILAALPYDRGNTSMRSFEMCGACRAEYDDPSDRRFHAQPNACPACGPKLDRPIRDVADTIRRGAIIAVKGLGGFHLVVDARNDAALRRLRERKAREEKPFALMFPTVEAVREWCRVSPVEARLLASPESPIVLLRRRVEVAPAIAPGNPYLGAMLPYTPLHHLLMRELGFPVVATSGNLSQEPICIDEREAMERLGGIADEFLMHDRPIVRPVEDSVTRVVLGRELILRRARGYAPLPFTLTREMPRTLATGAHLKNAVAVSVGSHVFLGPHVGDLDTGQAVDAFEKSVQSLVALHESPVVRVACDAHPDYASSRHAERGSLPRVFVQHHLAHVLACMADNELDGPVLGVAWDGNGLGSDGTLWGGEFLRVENGRFTRAAHMRTFRLPGGDRAAREPRRAALGVLYEIGDALPDEPRVRMLRRGVNSPWTSSVGRLFDAVASLVGLRDRSAFEGQAAMALEFAAEAEPSDDGYPLPLRGGVLDWEPMIRAILTDRSRAAARFHNTLAEAIVTVAREVGEERVVLSGGCFQNRYLTERAVTALRAAGFKPYWHRRIPPNDGGIAIGQIVAASWS
ncbi:MAG: carbamoyltransferase HypF [Planctomycetes bacterium]|nr:carbamoyltransferase HypF [Planctomycetota bacterium]